MAHYMEDIVDVELTSGNIHRSFANKAIGEGDENANRFGVRILKNGQPVNIETSSCEALFMAPDGSNILISGSTYTGISGNTAWVQLPQACYVTEGPYSLAIKIVGTDVTGTVRIVDGIVVNTGVTGAVAPTESVPTYQEILDVYDQMVEIVDGVVRADITQNFGDEAKATARSNIGALEKAVFDALGLYVDSSGYVCQILESEVA